MAQEEVLAWLLFGRGLEYDLGLAGGTAGEVRWQRWRAGRRRDRGHACARALGWTTWTSPPPKRLGRFSAGKYISEKVYTEVSVDQDGNTRINLNLDVGRASPSRARSDSDGDSGIGVYLEKDY
jgi:translocation and assembly module TamB